MIKIRELRRIYTDRSFFILTRPDGSQFTTNKFETKAEAEAFLAKVTRHAKELMEAHARDRGEVTNG